MKRKNLKESVVKEILKEGIEDRLSKLTNDDDFVIYGYSISTDKNGKEKVFGSIETKTDKEGFKTIKDAKKVMKEDGLVDSESGTRGEPYYECEKYTIIPLKQAKNKRIDAVWSYVEPETYVDESCKKGLEEGVGVNITDYLTYWVSEVENVIDNLSEYNDGFKTRFNNLKDQEKDSIKIQIAKEISDDEYIWETINEKITDLLLEYTPSLNKNESCKKNKKEKKLDEGRWEHTLSNGRALRDMIEDEDLEGIRDELIKSYKELFDNNLIDEDDYNEWTEELEDIDLDEDEIDFQLGEFYDLCDNIRVWIPLEEGLKEDKEVTKETRVAKYGKPHIEREESLKEMKEPIDTFKTYEFAKKTSQGWEVVKAFKDKKDNRMHIIAYRPGRKDYAVGLGYNADKGSWNQGWYDYTDADKAEKALKKEYDVEEISLDESCKNESCKKDKVEEGLNIDITKEELTPTCDNVMSDAVAFSKKKEKEIKDAFKEVDKVKDEFVKETTDKDKKPKNIKEGVEEETKEDGKEVKKFTIKIPHKVYTKVEDIKRINDELGKKAENGDLVALRQDEDKLMLSEPAINGIWTLFLNDEGYITKITLW